ncbi:antitoxin Xre/MbcA/ParS toxin-binding domain-containing protein [Dyella sp. 2YAF14]|uniref:antitoxin Xre/MbcA/ParS toxin-binding domain-containing protein n=1 Tax=Dyella sp. 2YAF14 TaxID=3233025 RepID=UPI003F904E22
MLSGKEKSRRDKLVTEVEAIVNESGDPHGFDAAAWVDNWLHQSVPALGGRTPAQHLETDDGFALLIRLLRQSQAGTYS